MRALHTPCGSDETCTQALFGMWWERALTKSGLLHYMAIALLLPTSARLGAGAPHTPCACLARCCSCKLLCCNLFVCVRHCFICLQVALHLDCCGRSTRSRLCFGNASKVFTRFWSDPFLGWECGIVLHASCAASCTLYDIRCDACQLSLRSCRQQQPGHTSAPN
jgi:hypothetical protein